MAHLAFARFKHSVKTNESFIVLKNISSSLLFIFRYDILEFLRIKFESDTNVLLTTYKIYKDKLNLIKKLILRTSYNFH